MIPNGIDTDEYAPVTDEECLVSYGIDPTRPYVLFVGRMTWQKLAHLLDAIPTCCRTCRWFSALGLPIHQKWPRRWMRQ